MEEGKKRILEGNNSNSIKSKHWKITTIVLAAVVVGLIVFFLSRGGIVGYSVTAKVISESDASNKLVNYFNALLGGGVEFVKSEDFGLLYKVTLRKGTDQADFYVTKDGQYFLQTMRKLSLDASGLGKGQSSPAADMQIPKTKKPVVELFVMSFCPYGMQAEGFMKPVYDLLKDSADFNIKFIVNVVGDSLSSVQSLHGAGEAKEDARQVCIARDFPNKLWDYVEGIDKECSALYKDDSQMESCWRRIASQNNIDVKKIDSCLKKDSVDLLKNHDSDTSSYGVQGSPTLIINGVKYMGARTTEAYKSAICSAFTDDSRPEECGKEIKTTAQQNTASNVAGGSC